MKARVVVTLTLVAVGWATLTAALFGMWGSTVVGSLGLAAAVGLRKRPLTLVGVLALATPLTFIQISLPEFAGSLAEMSCRVRAVHGEHPAFCQDVDTSDVDASAGGAIFSWRQHQAVRWLNVHMAVGGWLVGLEEVAWETLQLDLQSTAEHRDALQAEPLRKRTRMCRDGAADGGPKLVRTSDFAMDAKLTAWTAAKLAKSTRDGQHRWKDLSFSEGYGRHPWHVVLALLVPDSRLHARRDGEQLQMWWAGSIQYPMHVIESATLWRPIGGRYPMVLDEAVFCGLQMDGVWRPYQLEWHWEIDRDDPRLERPANDRRVFELVVRGGSPDFI